jgi:hypothetical protein
VIIEGGECAAAPTSCGRPVGRIRQIVLMLQGAHQPRIGRILAAHLAALPVVLTKPLWLSRSTPSQPRCWLICARTGPKAGNSTCGGNGAPIWGPRNKANQSKCAHVGRVRPRTSPLPLSPPSVRPSLPSPPPRRPRRTSKRNGALYCACEAQLVDVDLLSAVLAARRLLCGWCDIALKLDAVGPAPVLSC